MPYDCGTPLDHCSGTIYSNPGGTQAGAVRSAGRRLEFKLHGSADSARRCNKSYCRERTAEGGAIYLPSKPQRVKKGKGSKGEGASRWMIPAIRG